MARKSQVCKLISKRFAKLASDIFYDVWVILWIHIQFHPQWCRNLWVNWYIVVSAQRFLASAVCFTWIERRLEDPSNGQSMAIQSHRQSRKSHQKSFYFIVNIVNQDSDDKPHELGQRGSASNPRRIFATFHIIRCLMGSLWFVSHPLDLLNRGSSSELLQVKATIRKSVNFSKISRPFPACFPCRPEVEIPEIKASLKQPKTTKSHH